MVLLRVLVLLFPLFVFGQTGYNPVAQKQWFKDTIQVSKAIRLTTGAGVNKVLTSDAEGRATWQTGLDTASISNRINQKLNSVDTASLSNRINQKIGSSDTASLSNRINLKLSATDTASLSARINTKARVLISTSTASASSTIDFTGLSNAYTNYIIECNDVVMSSATFTSLLMRIGTGGSPTYQTGASDYGWSYSFVYASNTGTGTGAGSDDLDDKMTVWIVAPGVANGITSATIQIHNPSQSAKYHNIRWEGAWNYPTSNQTGKFDGGGAYLSATAVTAIRLYPLAGTITSGTFKLYGIL